MKCSRLILGKQALSRSVGVLFLCAYILAFGAPVVGAASTANISRSFNAKQAISKGNLVSLATSDTNYVEAANTDNAARLIGVAVGDNESLLAVNADASKVQVATSGAAEVMVSDVNGAVKTGDRIAASPFAGIGMKSSPGSRVIGIAQTNFDSGGKAATRSIRDKQGKTHQIGLGFVAITIGVGTDTSEGGGPELSGVQEFGRTLTGRSIATWRILLAVLVAVVTLMVAIVLAYGSIHGSIMSVGRNPLAKSAIYRTVLSVFGMIIVISAIAALIVYFLLRG